MYPIFVTNHQLQVVAVQPEFLSPWAKTPGCRWKGPYVGSRLVLFGGDDVSSGSPVFFFFYGGYES